MSFNEVMTVDGQRNRCGMAIFCLQMLLRRLNLKTMRDSDIKFSSDKWTEWNNYVDRYMRKFEVNSKVNR